MEGSPHDLLAMLRARRDTAAELSHHAGEVGVAVHEVLAELTRRAQVIADRYPEEETVNPRLIIEMPAVVEALSALVDTLTALDTLITEWADIVGPRREVMIKFLDRLQSEGFEVADDRDLTNLTDPEVLTDTHTWPALEDDADPELRVQQEAEKTIRTERATAYRERLARMGKAFEETQTHYTEQVRALIPTVLDG
ncbi:Uncharacterised protein [Mycobacteroides abscessus subsp. massiliense]|uniref:hypothetical protein n=1 Tax=Mycobacteroides TaxID=670516 RepID=UPI00092CA4B1|nr:MULTISPECIES: hypothetical protein [Mycobacteroides]SHX53677.1 Uncharacterised protein [Mycobacteroides abscessus subsp. abscessus]SKM75582.1 Uncharacterised protein [Mycobacteroides abscessus subsp. massiliense]SKM77249.1 Uncharacterised protein [Mycobacteroides abscessus subsp. massiliense]SKM87636.1 Uncharacterised protein [Mycobacteroides abscessus subsp. massiliense]SKN87425.1 Uncharacterised protein [Mycobacteroides abscessus subsp. massiliense]